jgi:alkylhydroperoxidase family enzyme
VRVFRGPGKKFRAGSLLDRGPLTLREREIVINRTGALTKCEYEWGIHIAIFALSARLTDEEVRATAIQGAAAPCWSAAERAMHEAVEALHHRATLTDAEYKAMSAHFDDKILEILLLCGFYRTMAYLTNGLAVPLEDRAARFPAA